MTTKTVRKPTKALTPALALSRHPVPPVLSRLGDCVDAVDTIELGPFHRAAADQRASGAGFLRRDVPRRRLHFYKPQPLRTLEEISADILAIEKEAEGLLDRLLKMETTH